MIYAHPGATIDVTAQGAPTGLTGTIGVAIRERPSGDVALARATAGIIEAPAGSGIYSAELVAPSDAGDYLVVWDTGGGSPEFSAEELTIATSIPADLVNPGPRYTTVAALRAEAEVPAGDPPSDVELEAIIARAEDQIDAWLGAWSIITTGDSSGRKIAPANVEAWQWAKLGVATTRLAAKLYADPQLLAGAEWDRVKGPDFETEGPRAATGRVTSDVAAPLNASGLRRLGARASA